MSERPVASLDDDDSPAPFHRLTAQEARQFRMDNPSVSPWAVVGMQVVVGTLAALIAWAVTGRAPVAMSTAYGALTVILPAALFARGLTGRLASANAATAAMGFMVWEMFKIALSVALLWAAPRWVPGLSWPALLVGLVLAMKVYWLALAWVPKPKKTLD